MHARVRSFAHMRLPANRPVMCDSAVGEAALSPHACPPSFPTDAPLRTEGNTRKHVNSRSQALPITFIIIIIHNIIIITEAQTIMLSPGVRDYKPCGDGTMARSRYCVRWDGVCVSVLTSRTFTRSATGEQHDATSGHAGKQTAVCPHAHACALLGIRFDLSGPKIPRWVLDVDAWRCKVCCCLRM